MRKSLSSSEGEFMSRKPKPKNWLLIGKVWVSFFFCFAFELLIEFDGVDDHISFD